MILHSVHDTGFQYIPNFGMQTRRPIVLCCRSGPFPPVVATDLAIILCASQGANTISDHMEDMCPLVMNVPRS